MNDFNAEVIEEFRANDGKVGGPFEGAPLLLLHSTGAKSGEARLHPVMYLDDGGRYVIFASKAGADTHPDWYHNLKANPETTIEVGADEVEVTAVEATGDERDELFERQAGIFSSFGEYAEKTSRTIPVILLNPRD
ncbi:MAG: nitroreductase family deazaflavin-dependent oxidoreductase [Solirubrobacterales bacterium]